MGAPPPEIQNFIYIAIIVLAMVFGWYLNQRRHGKRPGAKPPAKGAKSAKGTSARAAQKKRPRKKR